jgi:hypothetical protein
MSHPKTSSSVAGSSRALSRPTQDGACEDLVRVVLRGQGDPDVGSAQRGVGPASLQLCVGRLPRICLDDESA